MGAATAQPRATVAAFSPSPETYAKLKTPAGRTEFVQTYCVGCHNARAKTAGLVLEGIATDQLPEHAVIWEKVIKRLGAGEMPPRNAPRRPDMAVSKAMVAELIEGLDLVAAKNPHVGHTVIRRLNRLEYGNAVRDLLNVEFPYSAELPQDGGAEGFDNIADALSISPVLLDSYLKVARKVSNLALGQADPSPITEQFFATKSQAAWQEGMPFGTRGGVLVKKYFPRDGEYDLRAFLLPANLSPLEGVRFFHARVPVKTGQHTFHRHLPTGTRTGGRSRARSVGSGWPVFRRPARCPWLGGASQNPVPAGRQGFQAVRCRGALRQRGRAGCHRGSPRPGPCRNHRTL